VWDCSEGHVLRELISQGVRHYDFLATPNRASNVSAPSRSYIDSISRARSLAVSAYLHLLHTVWDSKEWLRRQLPPSAWPVAWLNMHIQTIWKR